MLEELRARFRTRFIDTARARLRRCLTRLGESSSAVDIASELHALAGEAAMLGFDDISVIARNGEAAARRWHAGSTAAHVECARVVRTLGREVEALLADADPMTVSTDASAGAPRERAINSAQRILVVDDSRLASEELAASLGDAGFDVRIAADRDAAVRELDGFAPALVLTDVQMPGVAPAAMCRALRAAAPRPVKIMLMSGRTDAELAMLARTAEADGFISKQHGTEHIVAHVRRALQEAVS
jgi:CheY-like chemotaxis protein/HPt (histidine-containing phosphotransfer) domain-containing protein